MPDVHEVRPAKWSNVIDLFDNGRYSAVWGSYNGETRRCLGVRWNSDQGELGYPNQAGYPLWYVEPYFLAESILRILLNIVLHDELISKKNSELYCKNIKTALFELMKP